MNLKTLSENLTRTIRAKEAMARGIDRENTYGSIMHQYMVTHIDELTRILGDVNECIDAENEKLENGQ